jgi:hypothetical protein
MLTGPLTVLSIWWPPVVYEHLTLKTVRGPLTYTTGGYIICKTVRGAININY